MIFWIGFGIGLLLGACIITLAFAPLVDRVDKAEALVAKINREFGDYEQKHLALERALEETQMDFDMLVRLAPKVILQRFYDSPFRH